MYPRTAIKCPVMSTHLSKQLVLQLNVNIWAVIYQKEQSSIIIIKFWIFWRNVHCTGTCVYAYIQLYQLTRLHTCIAYVFLYVYPFSGICNFISQMCSFIETFNTNLSLHSFNSIVFSLICPIWSCDWQVLPVMCPARSPIYQKKIWSVTLQQPCIILCSQVSTFT